MSMRPAYQIDSSAEVCHYEQTPLAALWGEKAIKRCELYLLRIEAADHDEYDTKG